MPASNVFIVSPSLVLLDQFKLNYIPIDSVPTHEAFQLTDTRWVDGYTEGEGEMIEKEGV